MDFDGQKVVTFTQVFNYLLGSLIHSCLEISMTTVVWTYDTFENNFEINHKLEKKITESSLFVSDVYFSFKNFLKINFVREISIK